jgi:hypothetical protein
MKILLLYTPRSGTNSIGDYFIKQNPDYIYYNQPFSSYSEGTLKKASYPECISHSKVFLKTEITNFIRLKISKDTLLNDFNKIFTVSRKNKKDQAISYLLAEKNKNFLNKSKRRYFVEDVSEKSIQRAEKYLNKCDELLEDFRDIAPVHFLYEDLFYGDFSKLFEYLNLEFIQEDFNQILDKSNKYMSGELPSKKTKTLF